MSAELARHRASLRLWRLLLLAVAVLLLAPPWGVGQGLAQAQGLPREASASDKETARSLMDAGRGMERDGDFAGALKAYLAADRIMQVPTTGISVGKIQIRMGQLLEARDVLLRVSRFPQEPGEREPFAKAREEAARLAADVAERIPSLQIEVVGLPPDEVSEVTVDGSRVPAEALAYPRKVNPGRRVVVASAPGHRTATESIDIAEREQLTVRLVLEVGQDPEPEDDSASSAGVPALAWVGFGVGAAGVLVGTITGAVALDKSSGLDEACPNKVCPPEQESELDSLNTISHTSTVAFVIGLAGVGVGVVALLLSGDEEEPEQAAGIELGVGPGSVVLSGRF